MANIAIFRINYKSDFILTLNSDAGWMTPFCIKFWTGAPSQAYFASFDGTTYTHCAPVDGEPTKLRVQFDDHHLLIGDLQFQIGYHFTVDDFPTSVEDEVLNQASVIIEVDGEPAQVMLDLNGETAPEIEFSLPAYANEVQRIANEQERIAAEEARIQNEETRISAEQVRQQNETQRINNEAQRIHNEETRIAEFASLKADAIAATDAANAAASLANEKAQLASDKAALAQAAATLANEKAQLAADKAALAQAAATLANDKAALAQQKAEYAQTQGTYAKNQGDYAKAQGDYAKAQGDTALADHERAEADHTTAAADHTQAVADHTQAASDHTRAEADHSTASADHTTATSDHTQAGQDHTTAAADHTQAEQDHTRAESDHTRAESDHDAVEVYVDSLGAFDISAYHATGGVLAKYADLTAALGTDGANIPDALRKGGMSVKFVQSSDNKYVQYRCMAQNFTTDVIQWQGVDDKPTEGSQNLVQSNGVYEEINKRVQYAIASSSNESICITHNNEKLLEVSTEKLELDIPLVLNNNLDLDGDIQITGDTDITGNIDIEGEANITPSSVVGGSVVLRNDNESILEITDDKIEFNLDAYFNGNVFFNNTFSKKIVIEGDSITYGYNPHGARFTYYAEQLMAKLPGVSVVNTGVSDSTITKVTNKPQISSQARMDAVINYAPNVILLLAGVNDYGTSASIGSIGDNTDETFSGALELIIQTYLQALPDVRLIYCTPTPYYYHFVGQANYHSGRTANSQGNTLRDYCDRAIEICKLYSIPVVDTNHDAGWLDSNEVDGHFNFTSDGIHLSENGYTRLTDLEVSKIKRLYNLK